MESKIDIVLSNGDKAGETLKELTKQANKLKKELNDLKPGTEAFASKAKDLEVVGKKIGGIKDQIHGTTKASDALKGSFGNILNQVPGFSALSGVLGQAKGGVGGLTTGFGSLGKAIVATGIGALVLVLFSLISAFSKFAPLMDKVEQIMGGISAIVDELTQRVIAFGQGLYKIISGNISEGLNQITNSTRGLTDSMEKAYSAGSELVKTQQDLEDSARGLAIANAKAEASVDRLIIQAKNKSLSDKEQIQLLKDARKIAEENFKAQDNLKQKQYDALIAEAQQKSKLSKEEILQLTEGTIKTEDEFKKRGAIGDVLLDKIKDASIERINAAGQTDKQLEKINNAESARLEKLDAEKAKSQAAQLKLLADQLDAEEKAYQKFKDGRDKDNATRLAETQKLEDLIIAVKSDSREKDLAQLTLDLRREIEALDVNSPLYAATLARTQEVARNKKKEINDNWDIKDKEQLKTNLADQIKIIEDAADRENYLLLQQLASKNISRSEFDKQAQQNKKEAYEQELKLLEENGQQQTELYAQIAQKIIDIEKDKQGKIKAGIVASFNAAVDFGNAFLDSQIANIQRENDAGDKRLADIEKRHGKESAAYKSAQHQIEVERKKNYARIKDLEKKKVRLNLLSELSGIWLNAMTTFPTPYNVIVGGLLSAAALIRADTNIKGIDAQQYEDGGLLKGPRHKNGGIKIEAEGGEFIFSRKAVEGMGVENLTRMNNHFTRKFSAGGPINPISKMMPATVSTAPSTMQPASDNTDKMLSYLMQNLDAVNNRVDRIKVVNVMTSPDKSGYKDKIDLLNQITYDADV